MAREYAFKFLCPLKVLSLKAREVRKQQKPEFLTVVNATLIVRCPIHNVKLICFCPACRGAVKSKHKAQSSKRNGKLGGRPPKKGNRDAS